MNDPSQPRAETPFAPVHRWMFRTKGVIIIVSCIAMVLLGGYVLSKIAEQSQRNPELIKDLPGVVTWLVDHRSLLIIAVIPACICGVMAMPKGVSATRGWTLIILATLWLIVLFAMIVICFVSFLTPLYQYQPL